MNRSEYSLNHWLAKWLTDVGVQEGSLQWVMLAVDILLIVLVVIIIDWISRKLVFRIVYHIVKRSKATWDDILYERRVFRGVAHIIPALIIRYFVPYYFTEFPNITGPVHFLTEVYIIIILAYVFNKFLTTLNEVFQQSDSLKDKPTESYIQLGKIVLFLGVGVYLLSLLIGKEPIWILTTLSAATAVLLLIFRDPILGLVASITMSANDIVRIGDWVAFEKYGADGEVVRFSLTTVQIQNWDNTLSTVPTYAFMSESFKNYRNMQQLGARRIKRSLHIQMGSVKHADQDLLDRLKKVHLLTHIIEERSKQINAYNEAHNIDKSMLINGRHMTNLGLFRFYVMEYLRNHPKIRQDIHMMVRHLQPGDTGIPVEVYCFTSDILWVNYEAIQADIMDHLIASLSYFDLEIFESPTGNLERLGMKN
jgi:miniconductance mechanosensitive channel